MIVVGKSQSVKNPVDNGNKNFFIILGIIVAVLALAIGITVVYQQKASSAWKVSSEKAPDNLSVSSTAEGNGQGQYITFSTKDDVDSIISVFTDAQCPVCHQFEEENGKDMDEIVKKGDAALRVHMMSFLDEKHNNHYSNLVSQTLGILANEDSPEVAWKYYNSIWENKEDDSLTADGMADVVRKMGASQETADKVSKIDMEAEDNVNKSNIEALEQSVGSVGTPTVFINGIAQDNAVQPNFFKEILEKGTPEGAEVKDGVNTKDLLKITADQGGEATQDQ